MQPEGDWKAIHSRKAKGGGTGHPESISLGIRILTPGGKKNVVIESNFSINSGEKEDRG